MSIRSRILGPSFLAGSAVLVGLACGLAPAANAAEGLYVSGAVGANWPRDASFDTGAASFDGDFKRDWTGAWAIGAKDFWGLRGEAELSRRTNEVDTIAGVPSAGVQENWALMGNLLYDFDPMWSLHPYLGGGIGASRVDFGRGGNGKDHDVKFAYQGIAGLGYDWTDNLTGFVDYRYFATPDPSFNLGATAPFPSGSFSTENRNHTVLVGLRYTFGQSEPEAMPTPVVAQPAPPPPPAQPMPARPAPQAPSSYMIFFDFDRSVITQEAATTLQQVASAYRSGAPVHLSLTGFADRSGSANYNVGLSKRRAEATRAALAQLGVKDNDIAVSWKGEADPLVPTADGVREPQNRRVQILFAR